ncbi:MAG: hypothetical protein V4584_06820 [Verrucomicrobiota bacterium]
MGWIRHSLRLLAVLATALLVSCIDCHEEIWLNADGSGRADVRYSLPAAAARFQGGEAGVRRMIEEFLNHSAAVHSSSCEVSTEGDRLKIRVRASFDSALDLKEIAKGDPLTKLPSSANNLAGTVKVGMSGRTVDFSRTITAGGALPGAVFLPTSQFKDRNLTYIIHLPVPPEESNATRTEDGGRTLVWDFPLAQAIRTPVTTRFRAKIPIPGWVLASAAGGVPLVGFLGYLLFRKRRRPVETGKGSGHPP